VRASRLLSVLLLLQNRGRLTARQTISTLPPGFAGSNFCSEILVSADGKFVYAGNRLHDSIGIFAVGADGTLRYVGEEWTQARREQLRIARRPKQQRRAGRDSC